MIDPRMSAGDAEIENYVWYSALDGNQEGPFSAEQVIAPLRGKPIDPGLLVWRSGMAEWAPVLKSDLRALLLNSQTPPPLTAVEVGNGWAWALALSPIWLAVASAMIVPIIFQANYGKIAGAIRYAAYLEGGAPLAMLATQAVCVTLIIIICVADRRSIKRAGWDTMRLSWWTLILVPFYLYRRDRLVRASMARFWVWLGALFVGVLIQ